MPNNCYALPIPVPRGALHTTEQLSAVGRSGIGDSRLFFISLQCLFEQCEVKTRYYECSLNFYLLWRSFFSVSIVNLVSLLTWRPCEGDNQWSFVFCHLVLPSIVPMFCSEIFQYLSFLSYLSFLWYLYKYFTQYLYKYLYIYQQILYIISKYDTLYYIVFILYTLYSIYILYIVFI